MGVSEKIFPLNRFGPVQQQNTPGDTGDCKLKNKLRLFLL